jgi:thymidine kinase
VIAVDEAFMLEHSGKILPELFFMGATIIVSTLQLSHAGLPFHEVSQFICYATKVEISPAVCPLCGKDAYFTSKISGERNQNIDIGGSDKYQPRCFEHYQPDSFNSTI